MVQANSTSGRIPHSIDRVALEKADLRVLLSCLVHMTGDLRWMEAPYLPVRDVRLVADPSAGFSPEIRTQIIDAVEGLIADEIPSVVIDRPDPALLQRMMSVFLGERVPDEYVPMVLRDMGLAELRPPLVATEVPWVPDVLIVGAGLMGICLTHMLREAGIPVRVVERHADLGGTWHENRYPGCGVDTPNHFYSFSFAPNPGWTRYFSQREEIQAYLRQVAIDTGAIDHVRFQTEMVSAQWAEADRRWQVTLRHADGSESTETTSILVTATGHFNEPVIARFPGDEDFEGQIFHTARWPSGVDLRGKRVGVIGTGASAVQVVPSIVGEVSSLTVFQRTPQWVRPVPEYRLAVESGTRSLFESLPWYAKWYRFGQSWRYGDGLLPLLKRDPDWPHAERSMNRTNDRHRQEMADYIAESLSTHPELIEKCTPDYPPFGKRILIDNGWYESLCQPHVELVTEPIEGFTAESVRTSDGVERKLDVVIVATGFSVTTLGNRLDIRGRGGVSLSETWADHDTKAYLGITVANFPNLFITYGPNVNSGHGGSGMWVAETQSHYIVEWARTMSERGVQSVEVYPEVVEDYMHEIDLMHEELVWTHPRTTTWYRTEHGKVRSPMPFRLVDYWHYTRTAELDKFRVEHLESQVPPISV